MEVLVNYIYTGLFVFFVMLMVPFMDMISYKRSYWKCLKDVMRFKLESDKDENNNTK